jgi:Uma2 family endonuclease
MSTGLRLTVAEYDRMVEKGAFEELTQKIELINGEIQAMNPAGPMHDDYIRFLTRWSVLATDPQAIVVSVQSGLSIPDQSSRPEPDIAWINAGRYLTGHPTASDAVLLIEVSYSSLKSDQQDKEQLYARAGIPEYWIVDIVGEQIYVHRDPVSEAYTSITVAKPGDSIFPSSRSGGQLVLSELFAKDE